MFSGFYKRSLSERRELIQQLKPVLDVPPHGLSEEYGDHMVENFLFNYELPLGVALNFEINQKKYLIPMVTEESSVIAAANNAGKILGNIQTEYGQREITGQIIFSNISNSEEAINLIKEHEDTIMHQAKKASQSMVRRGGGPKKLAVKIKQSQITDYLVIYLTFNPCDAMGANAINTTLESMAPMIESILNQGSLIKILSNYSETAVATAHVSVPFSKLDKHYSIAKKMADDIQSATDYAKIDIYRATTHNKGIMNGIDAVCLATGNDWRAVEASAHAYASRSGNYQPLTEWKVDESSDHLIGNIAIPIPVAVVGGAISTHPVAQWSLDLLERPSAQELSEIMAAVGLAQNFAALKALVSEGIQKGHMDLHASNLAIQVGAVGEEIDLLSQALRESNEMNRHIAQQKLAEIRNMQKEENQNDT